MPSDVRHKRISAILDNFVIELNIVTFFYIYPQMKNLILLLLILALAAYAQQERVAIIQTLDNKDSIDFQNLLYLTDKLRETAVKILPNDRFGVMTTESIIAFLGSQERAVKVCNESSCLAELGRMVSADYVAQGRIGRFGKDLTIKVELYNVKTGTLMDSFTGDSKDIYGLRDIIDGKAPDLFKKMLGTSDVASVPTPKQEPQQVQYQPPPPTPVAPSVPPAPVTPSTPVQPPPESEPEKKSYTSGIRIGFFMPIVGEGYLEGGGFSIGFFNNYNYPTSKFSSIIYGLDFSYTESYVEFAGCNKTEYALSIPIMLKLDRMFYGAAGVQASVPFVTKIDKSYFNEYYEDRALFVLGIILEVGLQIKMFAFDFRAVFGLTHTANNYSYSDSGGSGSGRGYSHNLYGIGVSYLF
jgi:TolB-like protein